MGLFLGWHKWVRGGTHQLWITTCPCPRLTQIPRCAGLCPNEHRCSDSSCVFKHKSRHLRNHAILPRRPSAPGDLMSTRRGCFEAMVQPKGLSQRCMGAWEKQSREGARWTLDRHSLTSLKKDISQMFSWSKSSKINRLQQRWESSISCNSGLFYKDKWSVWS